MSRTSQIVLLNLFFADFLTLESFLYLLRHKEKNTMGILNSMFGGKKDNIKKEAKKTFLNWIPLTSLNQLEEIKQQSKTETVLIFKHSTRCGISSMVIKQFENLFKKEHQHLKVYYLDLLNYRNISDEIGYTFQVMHQSPQIIVVKNEVTILHASHYEITTINLSRFL